MRTRHCYKDLTGYTTKHLTVLGYHRSERVSRKSYWKVQCDCGKIFIVQGNSITSGNTKSCGCHTYEFVRAKNFQGIGHPETGMHKSFWCRLKWNAKARKLKVEISMEKAYELFLSQNRKCALSGVELEFHPHKGAETTASLDRIDSSKGYIEGNVQWIHKDLNTMKNDWTEKQFLDWVAKIYKFRISNNQ